MMQYYYFYINIDIFIPIFPLILFLLVKYNWLLCNRRNAINSLKIFSQTELFCFHFYHEMLISTNE